MMNPPRPRQLPSHVWERIEKLRQELSGAQEITSLAFAARQGFYEKLILLDGVTLTLLFTVIGGLSHSATPKETLVRVGHWLFIGCWLFILSVMMSLLHNHLNIATLIHMTGFVKRASAHGSLLMLKVSLRSAGDHEWIGRPSRRGPGGRERFKEGHNYRKPMQVGWHRCPSLDDFRVHCAGFITSDGYSSPGRRDAVAAWVLQAIHALLQSAHRVMMGRANDSRTNIHSVDHRAYRNPHNPVHGGGCILELAA